VSPPLRTEELGNPSEYRKRLQRHRSPWEEYRDFGIRIYSDYNAGSPNWISQDGTLSSLLDLDKPFTGHAATTMEHLRVPLWAYYVTGDPEL
jgi:hypothetical protein